MPAANTTKEGRNPIDINSAHPRSQIYAIFEEFSKIVLELHKSYVKEDKIFYGLTASGLNLNEKLIQDLRDLKTVFDINVDVGQHETSFINSKSKLNKREAWKGAIDLIKDYWVRLFDIAKNDYFNIKSHADLNNNGKKISEDQKNILSKSFKHTFVSQQSDKANLTSPEEILIAGMISGLGTAAKTIFKWLYIHFCSSQSLEEFQECFTRGKAILTQVSQKSIDHIIFYREYMGNLFDVMEQGKEVSLSFLDNPEQIPGYAALNSASWFGCPGASLIPPLFDQFKLVMELAYPNSIIKW